MKKYELTSNSKTLKNGIVVYQIRALCSFLTVSGKLINSQDLGGWVESEENLTQNGLCWIDDNAICHSKASVENDAYVSGNAVISDYAIVLDSAIVQDNAIVTNHAFVFDYSTIRDNAVVTSHSNIGNDALICDNAIVCNETMLCGDTLVTGFSVISKRSLSNNKIHNMPNFRTFLNYLRHVLGFSRIYPIIPFDKTTQTYFH